MWVGAVLDSEFSCTTHKHTQRYLHSRPQLICLCSSQSFGLLPCLSVVIGGETSSKTLWVAAVQCVYWIDHKFNDGFDTYSISDCSLEPRPRFYITTVCTAIPDEDRSPAARDPMQSDQWNFTRCSSAADGGGGGSACLCNAGWCCRAVSGS